MSNTHQVVTFQLSSIEQPAGGTPKPRRTPGRRRVLPSRRNRPVPSAWITLPEKKLAKTFADGVG